MSIPALFAVGSFVLFAVVVVALVVEVVGAIFFVLTLEAIVEGGAE